MPRQLVLVLIATALVVAGCQGADDTSAPQSATAAQGARPAAAGEPAAGAPEGITVIGHGRVTGQPDTVTATVGVHVVRPNVDQAFDDAAAAADRVLTALQENGVAEDDIQTRDFSVQPRRKHRPNKPPTVTGYVVRNLVEAKIRDIDRTGEILAAVTDAAGDDVRVQGVTFALEENDAQLRAARDDAFEDARQKAEHYAELAGTELGALISVTEVSTQRPTPERFSAGAAADQAVAAPIMPGEQEVGVRLQARWALQ